ncbi:MAG: hypothetical protein U9M94_03260 [Patescibacteria group bacterium]|nr:hypothetical protein [Patescibacteria group bacterium]
MDKQNLENKEELVLQKYKKKDKKKKTKMRVDSKGIKDLQGLIIKKINK